MISHIVCEVGDLGSWALTTGDDDDDDDDDDDNDDVDDDDDDRFDVRLTAIESRSPPINRDIEVGADSGKGRQRLAHDGVVACLLQVEDAALFVPRRQVPRQHRKTSPEYGMGRYLLTSAYVHGLGAVRWSWRSVWNSTTGKTYQFMYVVHWTQTRLLLDQSVNSLH